MDKCFWILLSHDWMTDNKMTGQHQTYITGTQNLTKVHSFNKTVPRPRFGLWPWPLTSVLEDLFVLFTHPLFLQISGCAQNLFKLGPLRLHVLQNILSKKGVKNYTFGCFSVLWPLKKSSVKGVHNCEFLLKN